MVSQWLGLFIPPQGEWTEGGREGRKEKGREEGRAGAEWREQHKPDQQQQTEESLLGINEGESSVLPD